MAEGNPELQERLQELEHELEVSALYMVFTEARWRFEARLRSRIQFYTSCRELLCDTINLGERMSHG